MNQSPRKFQLTKQAAPGFRFLSFANDHGFLGGIIMRVPANGRIVIPEGIPDGDGLDVEETLFTDAERKNRVHPDLRNRLLTAKEIRKELQ